MAVEPRHPPHAALAEAWTALGCQGQAERALESHRASFQAFPDSLDDGLRVAASEIEMASGRVASGRTHLAALGKDATTKGFGPVARRAATAAAAH